MMRNYFTDGPFPLTVESIERNVSRNRIGNFGLGFTEAGIFQVRFVGRSDRDLNASLKGHAGRYPQFSFCYAGSPYEAYAKELEIYHMLDRITRLDNPNEPIKPYL